MDEHVHMNGTSTAEHVQNREELRRTAARGEDASGDAANGAAPARDRRPLLLRDRRVDGHDRAGGQVAAGARADDARRGEPGAPAHLRRGQAPACRGGRGAAKGRGARPAPRPRCDACIDFRDQLQSNSRSLAALFPIGPLAAMKGCCWRSWDGGSGGRHRHRGARDGRRAVGRRGQAAAQRARRGGRGGAISTAIGGVASGGAVGNGHGRPGRQGRGGSGDGRPAHCWRRSVDEIKHPRPGRQREAPAVQERIAATEPGAPPVAHGPRWWRSRPRRRCSAAGRGREPRGGAGGG